MPAASKSNLAQCLLHCLGYSEVNKLLLFQPNHPQCFKQADRRQGMPCDPAGRTKVCPHICREFSPNRLQCHLASEHSCDVVGGEVELIAPSSGSTLRGTSDVSVTSWLHWPRFVH